MTTNEKINLLRILMKEKEIDVYIIPTSDYHQSEYVGEHFKTIEYMSSFTGSAASILIFLDESALWTDGRYHIQAENELKDTEIQLFRSGKIGVPSLEEYLCKKFMNKKNIKIAFDGKGISAKSILNIKNKLKDKDIAFEADFDLIGEIWEGRPELPKNKIFRYSEEYAGTPLAIKLDQIRKKMIEENSNYNIVSSLNSIAWIYNLRGKDIKNTPVFLAFTLISLDKAVLYIDSEKLDIEEKKYLEENNVEIKGYFDIFEDIKTLENQNILVDLTKVSYSIYQNILEKNNIIDKINPSAYLNSIKNEVELKNTREIHIEDGAAISKFMYWLKKNYKNMKITEYSAGEKIDSLRTEIESFYDASFSSISAFNGNAAMMHYKAKKEDEVVISDGCYLLDSGGQYLKGTTDITRSFVLGEVDREIKKHFTLVLKGVIDLSMAKFLYGATGTNLDILARQHLWKEGIDYKSGTGHSVGHFLGVHEGVHGIRYQNNPYKLEVGMLVTNEPGVYIQNSHGIRIENELVVKEAETNEHGKFMEFETITFAPIDIDAILPELLSDEERTWLNNYHEEVYKKVSIFLNDEEKEFLKEYTRKI